ncbi:hypothetical protein J6590_038240 [Homalodisca vitripennis]|nr:hypothetical protein J6590_038240 [Homalodisca vitripennis]
MKFLGQVVKSSLTHPMLRRVPCSTVRSFLILIFISRMKTSISPVSRPTQYSRSHAALGLVAVLTFQIFGETDPKILQTS